MLLKMNSLVDPALIDELYEANAAGVEVDLIVRGICCIRPEVPGLSERIRVVSLVDRYLEHARVLVFENGGQPEVLLSSADWMQRNLDHRIEIAFPVLEPKLQSRVREILDAQLADTVKSRRIGPDGRSRRGGAGNGHSLRAQEWLYERAAAGLTDSGALDRAIADYGAADAS
jgi:polyphosphate kinase